MSRKEKAIKETVTEAAMAHFEYLLEESELTSKEKKEAAEVFERGGNDAAAFLSELCDCSPADLDNAANAARATFEEALKNAVNDLKERLGTANSTTSKRDSKPRKDSKKSATKSDGGVKKKRPTSK